MDNTFYLAVLLFAIALLAKNKNNHNKPQGA